jgi:hypothetical protein
VAVENLNLFFIQVEVNGVVRRRDVVAIVPFSNLFDPLPRKDNEKYHQESTNDFCVDVIFRRTLFGRKFCSSLFAFVLDEDS